jgi:hypothetical protein
MKPRLLILLVALLGQSVPVMTPAEGVLRPKLLPGLRTMETDPRLLSLYQPFYWDSRFGSVPSCQTGEHGEMACLKGVANVDDPSVISDRHWINFARLSRQCMEGSAAGHLGQYVSGPYVIQIDRFGKMEIRTWLQGTTYSRVHLSGICWRR